MNSLTLVIFGITSNLAQFKLIPALYDIASKDLLPKDTRIIGVARAPQKRGWIKEYISGALKKDNRHKRVNPQTLKKLCARFDYICGDLNDLNLFKDLKNKIKSQNILFYLATYPHLYEITFKNLKKLGFNKQAGGFTRLMVEKPIGTDLKSARKLNKTLGSYFTSDQIFRLDHYLGKETVQNILAFRFGNGLFEPLLNAEYIDHIQITAAEDFGVGDRGLYYDKVGALKDVGQNHILQMLSLALMDLPKVFSNDDITLQRYKLLKRLIPKKVIFGQYRGYLQTDTFFAMKILVKDGRFKNVPIYIRAGKNLPQTVTEVSVVFKTPKTGLFKHLKAGGQPNVLIYRIQPSEGIVLKILTKKPGIEYEVESEYMQFCYKDTPALAGPYERLILDALRGDQTFFNDSKEIEAQWKIIDPLVGQDKKIFEYEVGSWGPKEADRLIQEDGREWLEPSRQFCRF